MTAPALALNRTLKKLRSNGYSGVGFRNGTTRTERREWLWKLCQEMNIKPVGYWQSKDHRLENPVQPQLPFD